MNAPENFDEYLEYFKWRTETKLGRFSSELKLSSVERFSEDYGLCKLCQTAHELKKAKDEGEIIREASDDQESKQLHQWWYGRNREHSTCSRENL